MKIVLKDLFYKDRRVIKYFVLSLSLIIFSYLVYLIFNEDTINKLGIEDGFFEYFTALFFLVTSILFIIIYFHRKKIIHLIFALVFFIGMGEEISWGQRLFNFQSPEYFKENNIQNEFNLHNLRTFDSKEEGGHYKKGLSYFLSMNFLYKLFWLIYGVILPMVYSLSSFVRNIIGKIDLLVPPLILGIVFLINWLLCRITLYFLLPDGRSMQYYFTAGEISEFGSAFIFTVIGAYFIHSIRVEK